MSSVFILVLIIHVVAAMTAAALGTEFIVGDDHGWTTDFDYQEWAAGKEFYVGDKLVFKYKKRAHDVHKVDETSFEQCTTSTDNDPLSTGKDVITLLTPGKKWYICGIGNHCESRNQKLMIHVAAGSTMPPSAATQLHRSKYLSLIVMTALSL